MPDMGKHASNDRALRRARAAAWTVFISMAGTTMTFQVYHSIKVGRMPWELAGLYGVVPLLISICILEIVAEWEGVRAWAKYAAYAIVGGSMFMSASATGAVVLHAAPPHWSLLFGLLLDAAALLSVHFLLSGPRPLSKAEEAQEAERDAVLEAERAAVSAAQAAAEAERIARAEAEASLEAVRADLARAEATAEAEADRAETLTRKLAAEKDRNRTGNGSRNRKRANTGSGSGNGTRNPEPAGTGSSAPDGIDAEARILQLIAEGHSPSKAGVLAGKSDSYGRLVARLAKKPPTDIVDGDGGSS